MKVSTILMAVAASAMVSAPTLAAPTNPAASLSLANSRAAAPVGHKQKLAGPGLIIALVAAVGVGVGIYFAVRSTSN